MVAPDENVTDSDDPDRAAYCSREERSFNELFGFPHVASEEDRERFGVEPGDRCLDVGCGTGALMRYLLPELDGDGTLIGVDRATDRLAQAQEAMEDVAVTVQFGTVDALNLPFEDASFDAVASQFLLCILPEPRQTLAEMARVCRPGGTVASISCFCKSGGLPSFVGVGDWDGRDRYASLKDRFDELYRTKVRNPRAGLPNGDDLAVWGAFHEAGLEELRIDGYMPVWAPAAADWSEAEVQEYYRRRERRKLDLLDGLSDSSVETLVEHGLSRRELAELRDLTERHYTRLREDSDAARTNMDVSVFSMVLITGMVPDNRG